MSITGFLIIANAFLNCIEQLVKAVMFADDLTMFLRGSNLQEIRTIMQKSLDNISKTAKDIGFSFSAEKTVAMIFTKKYKKEKIPNIILSGHDLEFVNDHRILGIIFDTKLNWNKHIEMVRDRAKKRLNVLRMLCNPKFGAKRKYLLILHQSIILSVLDYGSILYGSASKIHLAKIDTSRRDQNCNGSLQNEPSE